ncbi:MAG: hypothetical protein IPM74_07480 [Crocinitomicaceae bacterium]|nr:hypothetical protein [Crocinitomicaceae bacterium]MBK8925740.1 hypothetical protein [Crocinitomicaceae bacterium]
MKINQQYNGTIIGGIFTVGSLLLTLTFIVPILSVLPGAITESILSSTVDNEPYSNVGKATIATLEILLISSIVVILIKARKTEFKNGHIIGIMAIEYFIIHALGFYIYWATSLDFRSDGQLIFGAVSSFPASSFGFVTPGILIDSVKIKPIQKEKTE